MEETLYSVGIDIGTSTTQLVISRLTLVNKANPFSVPRIDIAGREVLYRSGVHFTPLLSDTELDAAGIRAIVEEEYRASGFEKSQISTGAVIITGETARKENARQVLSQLSAFAGDFVVATAGPDLESILAARGAGADRRSAERGTRVLHCDVGGGTSNLALYDKGELIATGCFNVGGRLVKVDERQTVTYLSPVVEAWLAWSANPTGLRLGRKISPGDLSPLLGNMAAVLAQAAGLEPPTPLLDLFRTADTAWAPPAAVDAVSFSGGVADCLFSPGGADFPYGDVGALLGRAIRERPAFQKIELLRGAETIRATVVGAGSYSTQVSGSTIFHRGTPLPLKNLPVLKLSPAEEAGDASALAAAIAGKLRWYADQEGMTQPVLALRGEQSPPYRRVAELAQGLTQGLSPLLDAGLFPVVMVEADMAKALGQAMAPLTQGPLLCLDGISAGNGDYLDVGALVAGGAVAPVVVKTLAFEGG